ncbi:MAG: hypothetical protein R3C03_02450 [Pirellulaceae bacterium]
MNCEFKWFRAIIRLTFWLGIAWCVMLTTHELGHIVVGLAAGGKLKAFDLRPWSLPYSFFDNNPYPLATLWAGPILGCLVPVAFAALWRANVNWFIASFCVLANGAYIAIGWYSGQSELDTSKLFAQGASGVAVIVYCVSTIVPSYFIFRKSLLALLFPPTASAENDNREPA